jgi:hypothetical protein
MLTALIVLQHVWFFLHHLNVSINPNVQKIDRAYALKMIQQNQHLVILYVLGQYWGREILSSALMLYIGYLSPFDVYLAKYAIAYHAWKIFNLSISCIHKRAGDMDVLYLLIGPLFRPRELIYSLVRISLSLIDTFIHLRFIYVLLYGSLFRQLVAMTLVASFMYRQIDVNINKRSPALWIVELVRNFVFHPVLASGGCENPNYDPSSTLKTLLNDTDPKLHALGIEIKTVSDFIRYCLRIEPAFVPTFLYPAIAAYYYIFWIYTYAVLGKPLILDRINGVELWGYTKNLGSRAQFALTFGHRHDIKMFTPDKSPGRRQAFVDHVNWCLENGKKNILVKNIPNEEWKVDRVEYDNPGFLRPDAIFDFNDDTMDGRHHFSTCNDPEFPIKRLFRHSIGIYWIPLHEALGGEPRQCILPHTDDNNTDVLVVGAGFTGIMMAEHLRMCGVQNVCIVDRNDNPGGVWTDQNEYIRLTTRLDETLFGKHFKISYQHPDKNEIVLLLRDIIHRNNFNVVYGKTLTDINDTNACFKDGSKMTFKYVIDCTGLFRNRRGKTTVMPALRSSKVLVKGDGNTAFEECGIALSQSKDCTFTMAFKHYPIVLPPIVRIGSVSIPVEKFVLFGDHLPTEVVHMFSRLITQTALSVNFKHKRCAERHHLVIDKYEIHKKINDGTLRVVDHLHDETNYDVVIDCTGYACNDHFICHGNNPRMFSTVGRIEPQFPLNSSFRETERIAYMISKTL